MNLNVIRFVFLGLISPCKQNPANYLPKLKQNQNTVFRREAPKMSDDEDLSPEDVLSKRHRKEKKELQVNDNFAKLVSW